jgi:hypothetical protein
MYQTSMFSKKTLELPIQIHGLDDWGGHWDLAHQNYMNREDVLCLSWSWKLLIHSLILPSFLTHPLITSQNHPNDPLAALKGPISFLSFSMSVIPLFLPLPDCGLPPSAIGSLPLTLFSPDHHPFPHLSDKDTTWSDQFLYFQLTFCMWLIHRPDDGGSMHLWNVSLLQWDYTALYPTKLPSS